MGMIESVVENFSIAFSNPINIVIVIVVMLIGIGLMWFAKRTIDGDGG